jgi:hypothetical protein
MNLTDITVTRKIPALVEKVFDVWMNPTSTRFSIRSSVVYSTLPSSTKGARGRIMGASSRSMDSRIVNATFICPPRVDLPQPAK